MASWYYFLSFRNVPKIIDALNMDGSSGQQIEASKVDISSGSIDTSDFIN